MFSPDGLLGDVPYENMQQARAAKAIPAVQVKSPEGDVGWIPANRLSDAMKTPGASIIPIEQQEAQHPGFWHAVAEDSLGVLKGMAPLLGGPPVIAAAGIQQALAERKSVAETGKTPQQIQREGQAQAGYGPAYRYLATPAAQTVGVNVPGMEQSAAQGDVSGVLGHAAVPAAAAVAPVAGAEALRGLHEVTPSLQRARQGLAAMDKAYADLPIAANKSYGFFNELASKLERTGQSVPGPVRAFIERNAVADIAQAHPEVAAQLQQQGIPTHSPLTFPEAREFRTALNSLKYDKSLSGLSSQIGYGAKLLDDDIRASAPHPQFLTDYTRFNREFNKGKGMQRFAESDATPVGAALGGAVGSYIGGVPGLEKGAVIGGLAGRAIGRRVVGGIVDRVVERPAGAPDLTPPKLSTSRMPREAFMRDMLRAKEGDISTTQLNQRIKGSPRLRRIPQPPEEP